MSFDYKPEQWIDDAACAGHPLNWWFPVGDGAGGGPDSKPTTRAKALCAGCPVQLSCLDYALRTDSAFGIFGGLTATERRELRSQPALAENGAA